MQKPLRILMLGWEFPPAITGGLGMASASIANELGKKHKIDFLLPKIQKGVKSKNIELLDASGISINEDFWVYDKELIEEFQYLSLGETLLPYLPPQMIQNKGKRKVKIKAEKEEKHLIEQIEITGNYDSIQAEVSKYAIIALQLAKIKEYDLVHAHDWMTFMALHMIRSQVDIKAVAHIHSTEMDRNSRYPNHQTMEYEKMGLEIADLVFSVSGMLKGNVSKQYGIDPNKIQVVPNGMEITKAKEKKPRKNLVVGFIGRFTPQKGVMQFVDIASDLRSLFANIEFKMIGTGYLEDELKDKIHRLNLNGKFKLTGFLAPKKVAAKLSEIDLLIVPSQSEPFGLVILEAIRSKVPVVCSSGSGILEFIPEIPNVDAWDIFNFSKVVADLLRNNEQRNLISKKCFEASQKITVEFSASEIEKSYQNLTA